MEPLEPIDARNLQYRIEEVINNKYKDDGIARTEKLAEEVAEFFEAFKLKNGNEVFKEAADIAITLFAFCNYYGFDLAREIDRKVKLLESGTKENRGWRKKIDINLVSLPDITALTIKVSKD